MCNSQTRRLLHSSHASHHRLRDINPASKVLRVTKPISHLSDLDKEQVQSITQSFDQWEAEMTRQQSQLVNAHHRDEVPNLPPVRNSKEAKIKTTASTKSASGAGNKRGSLTKKEQEWTTITVT